MSHSSLLYARNSGNSYYFRSYIPKDLVAHFEGLKEFRISLKCAIKSRSNSLCKRLNNIVSRLYEEIRHGIKTLNIEQIKEILRVEIRKQILHAHHVYEGTNRWKESGIESSLKSIGEKNHESHIQDEGIGFSYTLDRDIAVAFADRYATSNIFLDLVKKNFKEEDESLFDYNQYSTWKEFYNDFSDVMEDKVKSEIESAIDISQKKMDL